MRATCPLESQRSLINKTVEATGSSESTVKRIIKENKTGKLQTPGKKRPNKKIFEKLDNFDLSVIRRVVHEFYSKNETPTLSKLLKKLKEDIDFPYGVTHLYKLLKFLGFQYKKKGRESILHERSDLVAWRESFLRRIKEIREKEPNRELVYTDETWLNADHRVKKEWVDLKALENPRRSIETYGTVGCTKDKVGKGKRIIIVDCITENGPVPGALWIFSTDSKPQVKKEKREISFEESAVTDEKARETGYTCGDDDNGSTSSTIKPKKRKSKTNDVSVKAKKIKEKKVAKKRGENVKESDDKEVNKTADDQIAGIMEDFDYHDTMNAENYEKYFEKVCALLKPNSVIIIDNASYHSRNSEDFPNSKWRKAQYQKWLEDNGIKFPSDAIRDEMWVLCKQHRDEKASKVVEKIAKKYGHEILRLPPYHCDLNAIELIWADEKNFVARENKNLTIESVENLFRKRREEISSNSNICKNCIQHVRHVEENYWKTDRIIDEKVNKFLISVGGSDDESNVDTDEMYTDEDEDTDGV